MGEAEFRLGLEVIAALLDPFVVLFGEHGTDDEPDERGSSGMMQTARLSRATSGPQACPRFLGACTRRRFEGGHG